MPNAEFSVVFAGPLVTFQDGGRPGNMRFGVPSSGPMDRLSFDAAHAALGNQAGQTAIEISLSGLILQCKAGTVTLAITGGDFVVEYAGQKFSSWNIFTIETGERLTIRAGKSGSWAYLAFAGDLYAENWLGSQATHSTSGFGGGALQTGQTVKINYAILRQNRLGEVPRPDFSPEGPIRVVIGPQDQHFAEGTLTKFLSEQFRATNAYDRMGMRLDGPVLNLKDALSIPSEPIVRGSVQVSGDGVPTVLCADHQTTGGYPKIATVISCDADRLTQFRSGQSFRFSSTTAEQAVDAARQYATDKVQYLAQIALPRGTLEQRLMRENLIHVWAND